MTQMDGLEPARCLRQEHPGHPMHLIAQTGHGAESSGCNAAIDAEFDYHLVKPAKLERLFQVLCTITGARQ